MPSLPNLAISRNLPRLYAIVDAALCAEAGRTPIDVARAFLSAGVTCLQLRAKTWDSGPLFDWAAALTADAASVGAMVIVNDRADVAALANAAGVHVGQTDLPPVDARRVVGPTAIVGLSTHTKEQLRSGLSEPVSYLAVGPVFGTRTKETGFDAIGLEAVRAAALVTAERRLPLVAIGGITLERAPSVIESGASSVAVVSGLLSGDPETCARAFLRALG